MSIDFVLQQRMRVRHERSKPRVLLIAALGAVLLSLPRASSAQVPSEAASAPSVTSTSPGAPGEHSVAPSAASEPAAAPEPAAAEPEPSAAPAPANAAAAAPGAAPDAVEEQQTAELLAALTAQAAAPSIDTSTPMIRFYGFMDVGLQRVWGGLFEVGLGQSDALNFVLGNVNLYMDVTPAPAWRGLAEVRFTTFPNGAESLDPATGQTTLHNTNIYDYTAPSGGYLNVAWGSLILERAHIDWMPLDAFNVRVGYFLTPYGIWNVDHGSPTRIMLLAPMASSYGFMPERQTGLDFFGLFQVARLDLGYHVYVSNGRTPSVDFTDDKAIGARVYLQGRRPVAFQLGGSFYYGTGQEVAKSIGQTNGMLGIVRTTTVAYSEWVAGGDLSLDVGALRARMEGTVNQTIYEEGKRPPYGGALRANFTAVNVYGLLAYQLPWLGMEPAMFAEWSHIPTPGVEDEWLGIGVGLNFYVTPNVVLRTQFAHAQDLQGGGLNAEMFGSRLIISY
jgi:hypothetical protein